MNNKTFKLLNQTEKRKIIGIDFRIFYILLLLSCLYLFTNPIFKTIGGISIILIFLLSLLHMLLNSFEIKINKIWLWGSVYLTYSIVMMIRTPTLAGFYSGILQVLLLLPVCLYSSVALKETAMQRLFKGGKLIFLIILIPSLIILIKGEEFGFRVLDNYFSPTIYKIMFSCTFFHIANSNKKLFKVILFSLLFLGIGERTAFFCLYIIFFVYLILGRIKSSKSKYKLLFFVFSILIVAFPFIYVNIQYTDLGIWLNAMSWKYTNANFFSGRNRIWEVAIDYFKQAPFWGYGVDNKILATNGINISTHNLYIYLLLQGGILGLVIFFLFVRSIWMYFYSDLDDEMVRMSAAYLIGILVFASFELILIVNAVTVSIFLWFIIGIGLIQKNNNKLDKGEVKI